MEHPFQDYQRELSVSLYFKAAFEIEQRFAINKKDNISIFYYCENFVILSHVWLESNSMGLLKVNLFVVFYSRFLQR